MPKKSVLFHCEICNFKCSKKSNYAKHQSTHKHLSLATYKKNAVFCDEKHECSCGRVYKHRQSLHNHQINCEKVENKLENYYCEICKKKYKYKKNLLRHNLMKHDYTCDKYEHTKKKESSVTISKTQEKMEHFEILEKNENEQNEQNEQNENNIHPKNIKKENENLHTIIETLLQENIELKHKILHDNKQIRRELVEIKNEPKVIHNTTKNINFITYLNTDCKNAINLSEFIQNIVINFDDLKKIETYGYLSSIKDNLFDSLNSMEKTNRPIHCTDPKRKQFYVKDNDIWDKDDSLCKVQQALSIYNDMQFRTLYNWKKDNPDWMEYENKQTKVNKVTKEISLPYGNEKDKIMNKIIQELGNVTKL
jgi:hypothetical protein